MAEQSKFELVLKMSDTGVVSNAQELAKILPEKLKKFNYIVDEGNVDNATTDRTKLNNLEKKFKEARKQFEDVELKEWYTAKKIIMDDIEKEIKKVSDALKVGIDQVAEKEKLNKMEEVRTMFVEVQENLPIDIEFEKFYDRKKYDVKAMSVKKITEDMQLKIDKVRNDWEMMQLFLPNDEVEKEQIKSVYGDTLNIGLAKAKADELIRLHEKVASSQQNVATSEETVAPVIQDVEHKQELEVEREIEVLTRAFKVTATKEQIIALGNFMNENGIKFEKLEV